MGSLGTCKAFVWGRERVFSVRPRHIQRSMTLVGTKLYCFYRLQPFLWALDYKHLSWSQLVDTGIQVPDQIILINGSLLLAHLERTSLRFKKFDLVLQECSELPFSMYSFRPTWVQYLASENEVITYGTTLAYERTMRLHAFNVDTLTAREPPQVGRRPRAERDAGSCVSFDTIYTFGGIDAQEQVVNDLHILRASRPAYIWSQLASTEDLPHARSNCCLSCVDNRLFILGGDGGANRNGLEKDSVAVYDLKERCWRHEKILLFHWNTEIVKCPSAYVKGKGILLCTRSNFMEWLLPTVY